VISFYREGDDNLSGQCLQIPYHPFVRACNAGLFISTGKGCHPNRVIDSYELIFVRSGVLGIQEEEQAFEVRANEALILWPGRDHWGILDYPPDLSFYWLHFFLDEDWDGMPKLSIPQHVTVTRKDCLVELFRRFLDDQESGCNSPPGCDLLATLMLCEIIKTDSKSAGSGQNAILANHAEVYIRTHFHEQISTSSIAQELGCNPDYLGRIFHRTYYKTITDRIHECRLNRAHQLLLEGTYKVDEVAWLCGYIDVRYFRQRFKQWKGLTPAAYRRLYAQVHVNTR